MNWATIEKEAFSALRALQKFETSKGHIYGASFIINDYEQANAASIDIISLATTSLANRGCGRTPSEQRKRVEYSPNKTITSEEKLGRVVSLRASFNLVNPQSHAS